MSVESLIAETAASAAAEEPKVASPTTDATPTETTTAAVPSTEETPEEQPNAEGEQPETETEPDLEVVPETSGDFSKYKPLFKDYPELRAILGREKAFSELAPSFSEAREIMQRIPSVADAETLVSDAESRRLLSQTFREDQPAFVESLKDSDPLAYQNLVKQLPDILAETDESLWVEQARVYNQRVLSNAFSIAQGNGDQELATAVNTVAQALGIQLGQRASQPTTKNSEVERLRKQLADRDKQDQDTAFDSFWTETDEAVIKTVTADIEASIKKAVPDVTPAQLVRMKKEAYEKTLELLNAQPQTVSQVNAYREAARKGKRGIADHKAIVTFLTQRAKQAAPKALKGVIDEWSGQVLKLTNDKTTKKKEIAAATKDVGTGPQGTTSAAAAARPADTGKPRSINQIIRNLSAGTYVAPR